MFSPLYEPPYYAVIFSSHRTDVDLGYEETAVRMVELAGTMPGFIGVESARGEDGFGITVSYWKDEESIRNWKAHLEHRGAQQRGMTEWYTRYITRVAKVERAYDGPVAARRSPETDPSSSDLK
jgi:heme-degrading monooxygenase HmoA